jgi:acyl carrier protein
MDMSTEPETRQERILRAIYNAVDEVNGQLPKGKNLDKAPDTVLYGRPGKLDSLGLVSLIVTVEQNIHDEFGTDVTLADDRALSQRNSPSGLSAPSPNISPFFYNGFIATADHRRAQRELMTSLCSAAICGG